MKFVTPLIALFLAACGPYEKPAWRLEQERAIANEICETHHGVSVYAYDINLNLKWVYCQNGHLEPAPLIKAP